MKDKTLNINVETFIQNISSWNDAENVGGIIRSLVESTDEWEGKSKLKALRKFICRYCPFVMDDLEIMTGITENWRLEDIIRILKKQNLRGKELTAKLTSYISNELVDVCSEESQHQVEKLKNKLSLEDLKDIVIMMMLQKNGRFGWRFVERISKSWTDDKLQEFVKLVLEDESYDDIGHGSDCGLFEIFPHFKDHISIREVMERESDDSVGSLVDFIEDDLENSQQEESSDDASEEFVSEEEEESAVSDSIDSIEDEAPTSRKRSESNPPSKKRKVIVIDSDSE